MKSEGGSDGTKLAVETASGSFGDPDQFQWVQSALGIVTWLWDIEANRVCWFGDLSPLLGLSAGGYTGTFPDYLNCLHPDDREASLQNCMEALKGRRPHYRREERVLWPDGSIHWLETYGRTDYRDSGRAYQIVGMVKDVTDRKHIELALVQSEERFAKVFRFCPAAILVTRISDGLILNVNPHFEEITGYGASEVIGRTSSEIHLWVDPTDREHWLAHLYKRGVVRDFPARFLTKAGRTVLVQMSTSRLDLDGEPGAISLWRDVTEQTKTERMALESQRKYATVFEISPEPMAITHLDGGAIVEVNSAFLQQMGRTRQETVGRSGADIGLWARAGDRERILALLEAQGHVSNFGTQFVHADGTPHDILISCSTLQFAEQPSVVWTWRDVTEIRAAERRRAENEQRHREELLRLANEDPLTGLPNRNWLKEHLAAAVEVADAQAKSFAILFIDFDGFKHINDSIGHAVGDELLEAAARRLEGALAGGARVARIGGDEFTVILADFVDETQVHEVARRLVASFERPFQLSNYELTVGISIGISIYPKHGRDGDALLRSADIAMYEAKATGRGRYQVYSDILYERLTARLETERALITALSEDQFVLHYQARVSGREGTLVGFEALLRWNNPVQGLIQPGAFIDLAEETGLIVRIGERVVELVCAQQDAWRKAGLPLMPVSVNVSAQEFRRPELVATIQRALEHHGLAPRLLEIEITESSTLGAHFDAQARLQELRALGLRVLIDDFGTGYSSLSQLQRLDVDVLKIDRSFTAEIGVSRHGDVLVQTIIHMARALGLEVVAEGVETKEQLRMLRALGCDEVQGFLISHPVPASELPGLIGRALLPPDL